MYPVSATINKKFYKCVQMISLKLFVFNIVTCSFTCTDPMIFFQISFHWTMTWWSGILIKLPHMYKRPMLSLQHAQRDSLLIR